MARLAITDALTELVADKYSALYLGFEGAAGMMKELLFDNPVAVHYLLVHE